MNKFFITSLAAVILLLASATANAQLLPISLGVKGGVNFANVSTDGLKSKTGFNAGFTVDLNLPANLAIMSGIEYTTKGAKVKGTDLSMNAGYLQLPIHLGYKFGIPGVRFHFNFGPYFAQGITGNTKLSDGTKEIKYDTFGDEEGQLKKFDWGLGIGVGATLLGKVQVRVGYDHGLPNIGRGDIKVRNRNAYVSAGLLFF